MDDTDMFLVNTREAMYFFHVWKILPTLVVWLISFVYRLLWFR